MGLTDGSGNVAFMFSTDRKGVGSFVGQAFQPAVADTNVCPPSAAAAGAQNKRQGERLHFNAAAPKSLAGQDFAAGRQPHVSRLNRPI
jgi:hypothetical protein